MVILDRIMKTPHKHAEIIKAWADGAEIETRIDGSAWSTLSKPNFDGLECEYRVKPEPRLSFTATTLIDGLVDRTEEAAAVGSRNSAIDQDAAYNALKAYVLDLEQQVKS